MLGKIFRKRKIAKHNIIAIVAIFILLIAVGVFANSRKNNQVTEEKLEEAVLVETSLVSDLKQKSYIEATGVVKAETQIDVVALTRGTVQSVQFENGDVVKAGQVLVQLYDSTTLTNLNNALTSYNNVKLGFDTTRRLAEESVRQAELGLKNAEESVRSSEIAIKAAEEALANAENLQAREVEDLKNSTLIAVNGYLNSINSTLDQIDYILNVEETSQLPGISGTLGAMDTTSISLAENLYVIARDEYNRILKLPLNSNSTQSVLSQVVVNLAQTRSAVDALIVVLDNTVPSSTFSDAALLAQKNSFAGIRTSIVNSSTSAQSQLQALQNQPILQKQQRDALVNAVSSAKSQGDLALLALSNARVALEQAKQGSEQQIIGAQSSLDGAQGQLSLIQSQVSDLTLKATISGQITSKNIEIGSEVNIGQKVAVIAQSDLLKIKIDLTSDEVYSVKLGQKVIINDSLEGVITNISPSADVVSRKVAVEIIFDNTEKELIPETFVTVNIPLTEVKSSRILIPLKAVTITQTERFVFVVNEDNTVRRVLVEIGQISGDSIEVLSGLSDADNLVIAGNKQLSDGDLVTVK